MSKATTVAPAPEKTTLRVDLANLTPIARDFISTAIAIWTDPAPTMRQHRQLLQQGRIAIAVDGGEVTWVNGPTASHIH